MSAARPVSKHRFVTHDGGPLVYRQWPARGGALLGPRPSAGVS